MKKEHAQLAHDAHECADSIPDLSKMVSGVQMLGMFELEPHFTVNGYLKELSHVCILFASCSVRGIQAKVY